MLLHEALEDVRNALHGQKARDFAHEVGRALLHAVEQVLRLLHADEGFGVAGEKERQMVGENARMIHAGDAGLGEASDVFLRDPDRIDVREERIAFDELDAQKVEVCLAFAHDDVALDELAVGDRNFVEIEAV